MITTNTGTTSLHQWVGDLFDYKTSGLKLVN